MTFGHCCATIGPKEWGSRGSADLSATTEHPESTLDSTKATEAGESSMFAAGCCVPSFAEKLANALTAFALHNAAQPCRHLRLAC